MCERIRARRCSWLSSLTLFAVLCGSAAAADPEVLFEDDFSILDPVFGEAREDIGVKDGVLKKVVESGFWWRIFYQSALLEDADIRVKVRLNSPDAEQGASIGVGFWAKDSDDFYRMAISDSGTFTIAHLVGKTGPDGYDYNEDTFVPWKSSDAIKKGAGEWNEVRVVLVGRRAKFYINGTEVASIRGNPPAGGSLLGLYRQGGSQGSTGEFSALKVVTPPPSSEPADDPNVLIADDFSYFDPSWGSATGDLGVKDGAFFIKNEAGYQTFRLNSPVRITGDFDASFKVKVTDGNESSISGAGLQFWVLNNDGWDYWLVEVMDTGGVGVYRYAKTRWLNPFPVKPIPGFDAKGWTEVKVEVRGRRINVVANGHQMATVAGQTPSGEFQFGLYSESGKEAASVGEFDDLVIKRPANP